MFKKVMQYFYSSLKQIQTCCYNPVLASPGQTRTAQDSPAQPRPKGQKSDAIILLDCVIFLKSSNVSENSDAIVLFYCIIHPTSLNIFWKCDAIILQATKGDATILLDFITYKIFSNLPENSDAIVLFYCIID